MAWGVPVVLYTGAWLFALANPEALVISFILVNCAALVGWWWLFASAGTLLLLLLYATGALLFSQLFIASYFLYAVGAIIIYGWFLYKFYATDARRLFLSVEKPGSLSPLSRSLAGMLFGTYFLWIAVLYGFQYVERLNLWTTLIFAYSITFLFMMIALALFSEANKGNLRVYCTIAALTGLILAQVQWVVHLSPLTYLGQATVATVLLYLCYILSQRLPGSRTPLREMLTHTVTAAVLISAVFVISLKVVPWWLL